MRIVGVLNRDSGTLRTLDAEAFAAAAVLRFAEAGHRLECRLVTGAEIEAALRLAAADPATDVVLAGGGDGTISTAAGICFFANKPLAVLPLGTMNLFARSLRLPLEPVAAVAALATGTLHRVDIATANGRPFVHQFAVGFHSRLVRIREGLPYRNRWGKMVASLRALIEALNRPLSFAVELHSAAGIERRRAAALSVSNNVLGPGPVPFAEALDRGRLGVYVVAPMRPFALAQLLMRFAYGQWQSHPLVSVESVTALTLVFPRRKARVHAVIDGELVPLERRYDLAIHAGGLQVLAPPPAD
jgi:diacylglycerol kinase family enzyme